MDIRGQFETLLPHYRSFLAEYGVDEEEASEVLQRASLDLSEAFNFNDTTESDLKELRRHARIVLCMMDGG